MVTLSTINPTLLDFTKHLGPDGKVVKSVIELLAQTNEIMEEMPWQEGNLLTGYQTTVLTGLPEPTWRKLYGGVLPSKGTVEKVVEACGMLEDYSEADKAMADLGGNAAAYRAKEDRKHWLGMNHEFADTLFKGNDATSPEEFTGFGPRYNSLSADNAENILQGAAGSTPSWHDIWLVGWGENTAFGIYPQGSTAGLQMRDLGEQTKENADYSVSTQAGGGMFQVYRSHLRWDCGLCLADWRYTVRIQYDQANLTKDAATGNDLIDLMTQAIELLPDTNTIKPAFYMNRTARSFLRRQIVNKVVNSTLTMDTVAGKRVLAFDEIPCRRTDALAAPTTLVS